jgi:erythromycin esterase
MKPAITPFILFLFFIFAVPVFSGNTDNLPRYIADKAIILEHSAHLDQVVEAAGARKLTLLGEASHGTHEYYAWRDSISRRLIAEKGYNFIAVEGDWASLYALNRYVKHRPGAASSAREVLLGLDRWPLWMWGNEEVEALAEWMRAFNEGKPADQMVGFYGMDVYDEWRSKNVLLEVLQQHHSGLHEQVHTRFECFRQYDGNSWAYAQSVQVGMPDCIDDFRAIVRLIEENRDALDMLTDEEYFFLLQNALVVKHAEKFYRKSVSTQDASAWNSRVRYMNLTVNRLLDQYGPEAKGIVWAHNTHVGDARFTEMGHWGQENIGHLARVEHGPDNVFILGFSTYQGRVKAGSQWGDRRRNMRIPQARRNSIERVFSDTGLEQFLMVFDDQDRRHEAFSEAIGNRAIGVVYDPGRDHQQNYVMTIVPLRYDAVIFFKETKALTPLHRQ